ncbi:DUF732 domain-containing protein [Mycolicibacterium frederiksbergense]|uniref:DUF732 domain-containing protein n=1 Tax=Mycolicibacterium frederiksbergense TaxID=117567 RepID=UPI00399A0A7D
MTADLARTRSILAGVLAFVGFVAPAVAHADPDTDFSAALHDLGIYGPKDYKAWIAKIACERLNRGVDETVYASANFVTAQLPKATTTVQAWQFLGLAYQTYCPHQQSMLLQTAETSG